MHLCPGGECEMRHGQKVPEPRAQSPSARTGTAALLRPLRSQPLLLPARILQFQASALDLLSELQFSSQLLQISSLPERLSHTVNGNPTHMVPSPAVAL